jgi:hypothetical protein
VKLALTALLMFGSSLAAAAQDLPAEPNRLYNPRASDGAFDLIIYVDGEIFLYVQDGNIRYQTLSGSAPRNAGSNYSQEIPVAVFGSFNMEKIAGRGGVELVEEPAASNGYTAILRVNDPRGGADLYHLRLTWTWNPADPTRPPFGSHTRALDSRTNSPLDYNRSRNGEFEFRGPIDGTVALHIRSDQVRGQVLSGQALRGERFEFSQPLPTTWLEGIQLTEVFGRGEVELVERPWEGNQYTAVVRIEDRRRGQGEYRFKLVWRR